MAVILTEFGEILHRETCLPSSDSRRGRDAGSNRAFQRGRIRALDIVAGSEKPRRDLARGSLQARGAEKGGALLGGGAQGTESARGGGSEGLLRLGEGGRGDSIGPAAHPWPGPADHQGDYALHAPQDAEVEGELCRSLVVA